MCFEYCHTFKTDDAWDIVCNQSNIDEHGLAEEITSLDNNIIYGNSVHVLLFGDKSHSKGNNDLIFSTV